jgi:hypothetical protein
VRVCSFALPVVANVVPALTLTQGSSASTSISNCWPFHCNRVLHFAVSNSTSTEANTVQSANKPSAASGPQIPPITVALSRVSDGRLISPAMVPSMMTVPAGASKIIPVVLRPSDLAAGQYSGTIDVRLAHTATVQVLAVTLNVKDGLWGPVLTIALALLIRVVVALVGRLQIAQAAAATVKLKRVARQGRASPEPDRSIVLACPRSRESTPPAV